MRGPEFLTLHPQMDEYMDQINEQLDVVSERLITLDGSPFSTLREFAENTKLKMKLVTGTAPFQSVWKISSRLPLLSRPLRKRNRSFW